MHDVTSNMNFHNINSDLTERNIALNLSDVMLA